MLPSRSFAVGLRQRPRRSVRNDPIGFCEVNIALRIVGAETIPRQLFDRDQQMFCNLEAALRAGLLKAGEYDVTQVALLP